MAPITFDSFQNIIDGKLTSTEKTIHNINPATEEPNPEHPLSTQQDVDAAVEAAQRAFTKWKAVPMAERAKAVQAFAGALAAQLPDFTTWVTKEMGMPTAVAKVDVGMGLQRLQSITELPFEEETTQELDDKVVITQYAPLGVAVGILPWNFPIHLLATKLGPAVLTGNTVIIKPSPHAPYSPIKACELAQQFFPPGVVQCLSGDETLGPMLTAHPGVAKVSFTGSIATGKKVMAACAGTLKRVTLELGGNDPAIVFPDADLEKAIPLMAQMSMVNSGQICTAVKRIYVHESIYDAFLAGYLQVLPMLKVADPAAAGTVLGPAANKMQFDKVQDLLRDIESTKLKIAGKAEAPTGKGYFIAPTIIDNPAENSRIVVEEQFGPVVPFLKWSDEEDVIRRANDTTFGLGASVWTQDKEKAKSVARRLDAGSVWVNSHALVDPRVGFGGNKQSGIGHELGVKGLQGYCQFKNITIPKVDPGPMPIE